MSFGFAVGDFVACIILIKDVTQALNASTGSAAEVKNVVGVLNSLNDAVVMSAAVCQSWNGEGIDMGAGFAAVAKTVTDAIQTEREKYSLIKGRGMALARHARKITWLFRKDDVTHLESSINGHLKALNLWMNFLSQLQTSGGVRIGLEILSTVTNMKTDLTLLSNAFQAKSTILPSLGYPWESKSSMIDNVLLHDAIGRTVQLPLMLLNSRKDLHETLVIMYRNIHGQRKILRNEYTITDEDSDGTLVEDSNWHDAIRPGMQLSLNMVFPATSNMDFQRCPRCSELTFGHSLPGQRRRCQKCQLTYRVFDKERLRDEAEASLSISEDDNFASEEYTEDGQNQRRDTSSSRPMKSKRKQNRFDASNGDFLFHNVHYHREVLVRKRAGASIVATGTSRELATDDLPPLHKAAADGSIAEIDRILDEGIDINSPLLYKSHFMYPDRRCYYFEGCSPLHIACWYGNTRVMNRLLDRGADINAEDANGCDATYFSIGGFGPDKIWFTLIERGADMHSKKGGPSSGTSLHGACFSGLLWLVNFLLSRGADLDAKDFDRWGAILNAVWIGSEPVFDMMLEQGASFDMENQDLGWNPLHVAASGGSGSITSYLLGKGFDYSVGDYDGDTPLHLACNLGFEGPAKVLLDAGADVCSLNNNDETPLHQAAYAGSLEIVEFLVSKGADITLRRINGNTPLHIASRMGRTTVVEYLLAAGAPLVVFNDKGNSPLHLASSEGTFSTVECILTADLTNLARKNEDGFTPLHYAAQEGYASIVGLLLSKGADINDRDNGEDTPLHCASWDGHTSVVELLISKGAAVGAQDNNGNTPLHYASWGGQTSVVELLILKGAAVGAQNNDGNTPLHDASWDGHTSVVELLILKGAAVGAQDNNGNTPLHDASWDGHTSVVELLILKGAAVGAQNNDGNTPLHYASWGGHTSVVELLISKGAAVGTWDNNGNTPLHYASWGGQTSVVELLISKGAAVGAQNNDGNTPLHCASWGGHTSVVELLISKGAAVGAQNNNGNTPLHNASRNGHASIVSFLLSRGADVHMRNLKGEVAIHDAAYASNESIIMALIEMGADGNARDVEGMSALRYAAREGAEGMLKLLVENGAEVSEEDREWWRDCEMEWKGVEDKKEVIRIGRPFFTRNCEEGWRGDVVIR